MQAVNSLRSGAFGNTLRRNSLSPHALINIRSIWNQGCGHPPQVLSQPVPVFSTLCFVLLDLFESSGEGAEYPGGAKPKADFAGLQGAPG